MQKEIIAIYSSQENLTKSNILSFLFNIDYYNRNEYTIVNVVNEFELFSYENVVLIDFNKSLLLKLIDMEIKVGIIINNNLEALHELSIKNILDIKFIIEIGNKSNKNTIINKSIINISYVSDMKIDNNRNKGIGVYKSKDMNKLFDLQLPKDINYLEVDSDKYYGYIDYNKFLSIDISEDYKYFLNSNKIITTSSKIDKIIVDAKFNNTCLENLSNKLNTDIDVISIEEYYLEFDKIVIENFFKDSQKMINIVCYKPTYLFKDLCQRFVEEGCILSDYPLKNAKSYIWMRPQELESYISGSKIINKDQNKNLYIKNMPDNLVEESILRGKSIAIHHGTCYKPIVQFDDISLLKSLFTIKNVVGVCEFEECYGQEYKMANEKNFNFIPIGFDDLLFTEKNINNEIKNKRDKINIGFVGRAYGTNDEKLLDKSLLSHPKGYRKGGDILLNTALRLKNKGINFCITILGQNWEELSDLFDQYKIEYKYYARETNIEYTEYPNIYSTFDLLFIGARCEGGPVSAIEALSLGIPIVSTNVGIVKYLNKISSACNIFNFDRKWHTIDYERAVNLIEKIYNSTVTFNDRLEIRNEIKKFTTMNWVKSVIELASTK